MQIPPQKQYIKKHLVLRPRKDGTVKLEVGDEIPRRWKEAWKTQNNITNGHLDSSNEPSKFQTNKPSQSPPVKNKEYFDKLDTDEYEVLDSNANVVPIMST